MLGWLKYIPEWLQAVLFFGAGPILFWLGSRGPHGKWLSLIAYLYAAGYWAVIIYGPIIEFQPRQYDFWIFALIFCLGFLHNKHVFLALAVGVMLIVPIGVYLTLNPPGREVSMDIANAIWHLILCLPIVALLLGQWWYYRKLP